MSKIQRFFAARRVATKKGRAKVLASMGETEAHAIALLQDYIEIDCTLLKEKKSPSQIEKEVETVKEEVFKLATKLSLFLKYNKITPRDLQQPVKTANLIFDELRKSHPLNIDRVKEHMTSLHEQISKLMRPLITGRTLDRLKHLYHYFSDGDRLRRFDRQKKLGQVKEDVRKRVKGWRLTVEYIAHDATDSKESAEELEQLDDLLLEEKLRDSLKYKIIILGAGESGKSTVVRQMRRCAKKENLEDLSPEDRQFYHDILRGNVIESMQALLTQIDGPLESEELQQAQNVFSVMQKGQRLTKQHAQMVSQLWNNKQVRDAWKANKLYVPDSAPYYFENVSRFAKKEFELTHEDLIMSRLRTTGVQTTVFNEYPPIVWSVVDVGGQRSERRKWVQVFDNVTAVVFVVNLAGFNQVTFEETGRNRMHEALDLFEATAALQHFQDIPIFLVLNKMDLFDEMLKYETLDVCFSDYKGKTTQNAIKHITNHFQNRMPSGKKLAGVNVIAARYENGVRLTFQDVREALTKIHDDKISGAAHQLDEIEQRRSQREKP